MSEVSTVRRLGAYHPRRAAAVDEWFNSQLHRLFAGVVNERLPPDLDALVALLEMRPAAS